MTPRSLSLTRVSDVRQRLGAWTEQLARETRKHPIRTVAAAVGVGFVLGGGLFSRVGARLLLAGARTGVRMAVVPFIAQSLAALAEELIAPSAPPIDVGGAPTKSQQGKTRRRTHEAQ